MPRRIINLVVEEISTVKRAANERSKVLIRKGQDMENEMGVVSVAKHGQQALDSGVLTQETFTKLQERLAQEQFPNAPTMGHALALWYATPHGAEMLNHAVKKSYRDMQVRTALGNTDEVLKSQRNAETHEPVALGKPKSRRAKPVGDDEDASASADDVGKAIAVMVKGGLSHDEAVTKILRKARGQD